MLHQRQHAETFKLSFVLWLWLQLCHIMICLSSSLSLSLFLSLCLSLSLFDWFCGYVWLSKRSATNRFAQQSKLQNVYDEPQYKNNEEFRLLWLSMCVAERGEKRKKGEKGRGRGGCCVALRKSTKCCLVQVGCNSICAHVTQIVHNYICYAIHPHNTHPHKHTRTPSNTHPHTPWQRRRFVEMSMKSIET